jgi:polyhydroxyalkanoate synthesis regulator phasin
MESLMLPDEMEAEKNRKIIVSQAETIEILKRNVRDLQEQLNNAHIRIRELTESKL